MGGVLRYCWVRLFVFLQGLYDLYRYIYYVCDIVPSRCNPTVDYTFPVLCHFIFVFDSVDDLL